VRAEVRGEAGNAVSAVIGSWDPLLPSHLDLFRTLARRARAEELRACAVVIAPAPMRYMHPRLFRDFDDLETRLALIRESGIETMLIVHFDETDLDATAADFLDLICGELDLKRLWLGATQSLGRGVEGSRAAITTSAGRFGLELSALPIDRRPQDAQQIWAHLARGEISLASRMVGRPPVRARPAGPWAYVGWPVGNYRAVPLEQARDVLFPPWQGAPIDLQVVRQGQSATAFEWPSSVFNWLAIVDGDRVRPGTARAPRRPGGATPA
jgi:FAD synthetase